MIEMVLLFLLNDGCVYSHVVLTLVEVVVNVYAYGGKLLRINADIDLVLISCCGKFRCYSNS